MTGTSLVEQLLAKNHKVRIIFRTSNKLPADILENPNTTAIEATLLDLTDEKMTEHVKDCDAVVSCLGHVMDFKGVFGEPKSYAQTLQRDYVMLLKSIACPNPPNLYL